MVCMVYFSASQKNMVTLICSAQRKHAFLVKLKYNQKSPKINFSGIIASDIRTQFHKVADGWIHIQFLARY